MNSSRKEHAKLELPMARVVVPGTTYGTVVQPIPYYSDQDLLEQQALLYSYEDAFYGEQGSSQQSAPWRFRHPKHKPCFPQMRLIVLLSILIGIYSLNNMYYQTYGFDSTDIEFSLKREGYSALDYFDTSSSTSSFLTYAILDGHTAVIEPNQSMKLHIFTSGQSSGFYKYTVCPTDSTNTSECHTGFKYRSGSQKTVSISCSTYSTYDITVYKATDFNQLQKRGSGTAICLYVRRELRDLTDDDRDAFLDASYVMYSTDESTGQALYGSNFHNSSYLHRFHHFNAAQQEQDHIHEGNGFLMQHLKLTNLFDNSLLSIDPSNSIPYWDFTMDAMNELISTDNTLYSADYYGSVYTPYNLSYGSSYAYDNISLGRILDGRWANLTVESNPFSSITSVYGYMRSPWGMNPSPYISRFAFDFTNTSFPSCEDHYDLLQYTDMMDFFLESSYSPHASVHGMLGGYYGCNAFDTLIASGHVMNADEALNICQRWDFYMKELWRAGLVSPKTNCNLTNDLNSNYCGFDCNNSTMTNITDWLFPQIITSADIGLSDAESVWQSFICGGDGGLILTGDHLESSSAGDPSFWVIHPTLERLLHAKLMVGGFDTDDWATDSVNDYVCNKPSCYNSTTGATSYNDNCCYGHFEDDQLLDAEAGDRFSYTGYTNAELLSMTDPTSSDYSMDYIYDGFTWSHCITSDFTDLLTELNEAKSSGKPRAMHSKQVKRREWKRVKIEANRRGSF